MLLLSEDCRKYRKVKGGLKYALSLVLPKKLIRVSFDLRCYYFIEDVIK